MNWDLDDESGNSTITDGRDLPWLQDTKAANVQGAFGAGYRDLVFVDAWNRKLILARTINLDHDKDNLSFEVNRGVVKGILRIIAEMTDVDEDGVADDWEERFLGGLDENVGSDLDGDGEDLLLEYGLGSHPGDSGSLPAVTTGTIEVEGEKRFSLSFRTRLGVAGGLHYIIESSASGGSWSNATRSFEVFEKENPYDGTGTEIVTFVATGEVAEGALFRVRVGLGLGG